MNDDNNKKLMTGLLDQAYMEVIPTSTILDRLVHIPRHSYVSITCSPVHGLEPTLALTEQLRALPEERQLNLVPHIAARMVRDKNHLEEVLKRLQAAKVTSIFVPGGDAPKPVGQYSDSLQLLRDMADIGHDMEDIGVAAYPEGHPLVSDSELLRFLQEKQSLANYLVTQMCFDSRVLVDWIRDIRRAGITLPAWIGLPGVIDMSKLISLSLRIGVGQSLKQLKKQKGLLKQVLSAKPYRPDDLLEGLRPHLDEPGFDVPGLHLFSFNEVERTEQWRAEALQALRR